MGPAIVTADADLDLAARAITRSRTLNTGQVCNAAERIYVDRKVAEEFTEKLVRAMQLVRYGDPLGNDEIDMGPIINHAGVEKIDAPVLSALDAGAEAALGGGVADLGRGSHYKPAVLVNCQQDMGIISHETFGPLLPLVEVDSLNEAIAHANDTTYGLASSIYTTNVGAMMRPATSCASARPTSTARISTRCRASMPAAASRGSAASTASTGSWKKPKPTSVMSRTDDQTFNRVYPYL